MNAELWKLFQKNVKTVGKCEVWTGPGFGEKGFGLFKSGDIKLLAHLAAFIHFNGGYKPSRPVLQSCGNKRCVTEKHLSESDEVPRF